MWKLITTIAFVYGTLLGSFLNVVALRTSARLEGRTAGSILTGRSACPHCGVALRWWELVPVVSFFALRGRCAHCHARISWQYPLVEIALGIIVAKLWANAWPNPDWFLLLTQISIASILVVLLVIDLKVMLLPDYLIVWLCVLVAVMLALRDASWLFALWGILVGAGFLFFLWLVTRGRGIGLGDVKLMVPLGALLGGWGTTVLLFAAFISGGLVSIYLLWKQRVHLKTAIPFGPFLIGSGLLLILYPDLPATLLPYFLPWLAPGY